MQVSIDSKALGILLAHAVSAARIVGNLDHPIVAGPLADHIDAIVHELSELAWRALGGAVVPDDRELDAGGAR